MKRYFCAHFNYPLATDGSIHGMGILLSSSDHILYIQSRKILIVFFATSCTIFFKQCHVFHNIAS